MRSLFCLISIFAALVACSSDSQQTLKAAQQQVRPTSVDFIGLGPTGKTDFVNELTIYFRATDPLPRCEDCALVRVLWDRNPKDAEAIRVPYEAFVEIDTMPSCGRSGKRTYIAIEKMKAITKDPGGAREAGQSIEINRQFCDLAVPIVVRTIAPKCTGADPECKKYELRNSYDVNTRLLLGLRAFTGSDSEFPNQRRKK